MKLALMQPYVLPYVGTFALIAQVDRWVVFDRAQYIKGGWINRNRVLKPGGGWRWFQVPVARHGHDTPISEVRIAPATGWRRKLVGSVQHYRGRAPHFASVMDLLDAIIAPEFTHIVDLAVHSQARVCDYLGIPFPVSRLSEHPVPLDAIHGPGDWGRVTCVQLGADVYVNPIGGRHLFDPEAYRADGVDIRFLQARPVPYDQGQPEFEPWLSILDVLMFNSVAQTRDLLSQVDVVRTVAKAA